MESGVFSLQLQDDGKALARYGAAELRTDRDVPVRYRRLIVDAAHRCPRPDVSPALIAAMAKPSWISGTDGTYRSSSGTPSSPAAMLTRGRVAVIASRCAVGISAGRIASR